MGNTLFCVSYRFHIFKITRNCECDVTIYGRKIKISKKKLKCMLFDKRLVPYSGLKKEPFSGSHNGMRYMMRSDNGRDSTTFTVFVYPEPWCFEQTPEDQIESHTFDSMHYFL